MQPAPIPENEKQRLASLHNLGLLNTPPEERFDLITRTATRIFHVSISTLTLVDSKREWFKSCQGLPQHEGDRAVSFCGHALLAADVLVIPDTKKDDRFADNPMVTGEPYLRFYAGVPVMSADGTRVGVFCIKDTKPRKFSKDDEEVLKGLAFWAEVEMNSHNLGLALREGRKRQAQFKAQVQELENAKIAARNVLEDLQVEKETLAHEKAKYEALLEGIGDGVVAVDRDDNVIVMNKVAENLLGFINRELIGKSFIHAVSLGDAEGNRISDIRQPIILALTLGKTTTTYYFIRKDGTKFPAAITATPVLLHAKPTGAIIVFRDVTKEKEIDRAKSEFISIASHQLRTPMTSIQWVIERFLKTEKPTQKGREYLEDIHMAVARLSSLVDLLLNVSRIEAGKVGATSKPLELVVFVKMYLKEYEPLVAKKHLRVAFEKHPSTLNVITDHITLRNIVHALISNALEYTPDGGEIEIAIAKKDSTFLLTIRDTGIGIPKEEQDHVFEKFFRGSNAKLVKTDGTGLGLYIAAQAVKLLQGKIWVEPATKKGSVFFVELPIESKSVTEEQHTT